MADKNKAHDSKPTPTKCDSALTVEEKDYKKCVEIGDANYADLRKEWMAAKHLYEDVNFVADNKTVFGNEKSNIVIVWKRPWDIVERGTTEPKFISDGTSRFDIVQGELYNSWLLAAISSLTLYPKLFEKVVPPNQDFSVEKHFGAFHFRFWQYGHWKDVIVDDRLPTVNGKLYSVHSPSNKEFWPCLIEKAFAKLQGGYYNLNYGCCQTAMQDLTGGVLENYELEQNCQLPRNLVSIIQNSLSRGTLICANSRIATARGQQELIRLRSPHGPNYEWTGPWSDNSEEWKTFSEAEKNLSGIVFANDGEFWMCYQDFKAYFNNIELCHLGPKEAAEAHGEKCTDTWKVDCFHANWAKGVTAGGSYTKSFDTFHQNPQFHLNLPVPDKKGEKCTVLVGLIQKERRSVNTPNKKLHHIQFSVFKVSESTNFTQKMDNRFFHTHRPCEQSLLANYREMSMRLHLDPGSYVIVPHTELHNQTGDFILRVFSEKLSCVKEIDAKTGVLISLLERHMQIPDQEKHNETMKLYFDAVAGDDRKVDCFELQILLKSAIAAYCPAENVPKPKGASLENYKFPKDISLETCRSLVLLFDKSRTGGLEIEELSILWHFMMKMMEVFKEVERGSGNISSADFQKLLNERCGLQLSSRVIKAAMRRYALHDGKIRFGKFVGCMARLMYLMDSYKRKFVEGNICGISLDDFIELAM